MWKIFLIAALLGCKMRLLRFAIANFRSQSPIKSGATRIGDVDVTIAEGQGADKKDRFFLVTANAILKALPEKDYAGRILVPSDERESCEFAIDAICNIVSTFHGCSRSILSPIPCVAFECEDTNERKYLDESRGILATHKGDSGVRSAIPMEANLLTSVSDRLIGVALLAEAYAGSESGRYREFVRFFELAFRAPFTQLNKKLCKFFEPTPFGYTRTEINRWVALRHPLIHADMKKSSAIAVTGDVQRHILRMEQAALDVLFNKASWSDKSIERRAVWYPEACTTSENGNIIVKQGSKLSMLFRTYDEFDVYPRILNAKINKIEESWYFKINEDDAPKLST